MEFFDRLWLVINHNLIKRSFQTGANLELRQKAFDTALHNVIVNRMVEDKVHNTNFAWLLKPILHWHAIVIILCVVCGKPEGYDEAWRVLGDAFDKWSSNPHYYKSKLWQPLYKLYESARRSRLARLTRANSLNNGEGHKAEGLAPMDFMPTASFDVADPAFQIPMDFENIDYEQNIPADSLGDTQGLDMTIDNAMFPQDPLLAEEIPWDWSAWEATYNASLV